MHRKTDLTILAESFEAIIFDLDGVAIETDSLHAVAWKLMYDAFLRRYAARENLPFEPFAVEKDYQFSVDGRLRLDGLRRFLESRGINLPDGRPEDPPEADTILNLGKREQTEFLQQIREQGTRVLRSTVDLLHSAQKHGLKTAVISSGKSCAMIPDAATLADLFDARVDGVDSERKGIPGKPAPDIFLEAARQLHVRPERTVVIADTVSGVQAGRAGGFGRVIGIHGGGGREALLPNGADMVGADLSEIRIGGEPETATSLPSALDDFARLARQAEGKRIAVFLDYDGTLTPIVETPEQAVMAEDIREAVLDLSRHCAVGIISGRDLEDVRDKVRIDSIVYAGSHGFDIFGPEDLQVEHRVGEEFLPVLDTAEQALLEQLKAIEGTLVERKKFAIAIHYRRVAPENVEGVETIVDAIASQQPMLRKTYGKMIFELQPQMDWHKGKALLSLLATLGLDGKEVLPLFIGDDLTDEDAFRAMQGRGIGIVVWDQPYETAAAYSLNTPDQVRAFLVRLIPLCRGPA